MKFNTTNKYASVAVSFGVLLLVICTATVAWASSEEGGFPLNDMSEAIVNFLVFGFLLYYFLKKPIGQFFKERSQRIGREMEEAGRLRREAQALLDEYSAKLDSFEKEKDEILDGYRREGARERDDILAAAKLHAERLKEDSAKTIEFEIKAARETLKGRMVEAAVDLAREHVKSKLDSKAGNRLVDDYIGAIGGADKAAH